MTDLSDATNIAPRMQLIIIMPAVTAALCFRLSPGLSQTNGKTSGPTAKKPTIIQTGLKYHFVCISAYMLSQGRIIGKGFLERCQAHLEMSGFKTFRNVLFS